MSGHMAHYGNGYVMLDDLDLRADYDHPQVYTGRRCDGCGRLTGGTVRVVVDHEATGTGTTGTGDTVVRRYRTLQQPDRPRNPDGTLQSEAM